MPTEFEKAFETDEDSLSTKVSNTANTLYGKKVKSIPKPVTEVGIDLDDSFLNQIVGESSHLDIAKLESFTQISQQRDTLMSTLDTMAEDPTISAVLEIYAEDATETNEKGQSMWVESDDPDTASFVQYLLDIMNVDKHLFSWAKSLCLYGDLYIKLYRESDLIDDLFDDKNKAATEREKLNEAKISEKSELTENLYINVPSKLDNYVYYIEAVPNPAEMFELIKYGKSYAYISADVRQGITKNSDSSFVGGTTFKYHFNKQDVEIYQPTEFVHACIDEMPTRYPEEVEIFMPDDYHLDDITKQKQTERSITYRVRRGQSIFYNVFKIWREVMLLQNALLLNRLTKSSVVRVISVEVGDQPKEEQRKQLIGIKQLFEQKTSINTGNSLTEYTNPGPMENNIYVPTHGGQGSISITQAGGDIDVKGLSDVDYFNNLLFGALKIPKQFLGFTNDDAGFSGGQSLSLISARYAKTIKRIQNTLCQMMTDVINLILIDRGQQNRINKFTIRMQEPTTQEEIDRRDNLSSEIAVVSDIMNLVSDIESPDTKLRILKMLLSNIINDANVLKEIQDEIDKLASENDTPHDMDSSDDEFGSFDDFGGDFGSGGTSASLSDFGLDDFGETSDLDNSSEMSTDTGTTGELPSPADLNVGDFSDNSTEL